MKFLTLLLTLFFIASSQANALALDSSHSDDSARIAIIVDDLGYNFKLGIQAIGLEYPITYAVIPYTPFGKSLSRLASVNGKEVIVHAPMQANSHATIESGLSVDMDEQQIQHAIGKMIAEFPDAKGVNNHGGSVFSQDRERAHWLISSIKDANLYFVDSRTSPHSQLGKTAAEFAIPYAERDVFLDNVKDVAAITIQLNKLKKIATEHGKALGIGHPYPETIKALKSYLPELKKQGFKLVYASEILTLPATNEGIVSSISSENTLKNAPN